MSSIKRWFYIVFVLSNISLPILHSQHFPSDLKWKNRIILIFTPELKHASTKFQAQQIKAANQEYQERDLVLFYILPDQVIDVNGRTIQGQRNHSLNQVYQIKSEEWTYILLGKDGGIKLPEISPVSNEMLFATIDAMPMRRAEMKRKRN